MVNKTHRKRTVNNSFYICSKLAGYLETIPALTTILYLLNLIDVMGELGLDLTTVKTVPVQCTHKPISPIK